MYKYFLKVMSVQKKCRKPDDDGAIVVGWTVDVIHSTMVALLPLLKKIIIVVVVVVQQTKITPHH